MKRRGLGENASTYRRLGRDAERQGRNEEAQRIYAQAPQYRSTGIQKRMPNGKIVRYKNLATFHRECPTRSRGHNLVCDLQNVRQLTDGSGMASVKVTKGYGKDREARGVWRLHFADYGIMVRDLKKRMT